MDQRSLLSQPLFFAKVFGTEFCIHREKPLKLVVIWVYCPSVVLYYTDMKIPFSIV